MEDQYIHRFAGDKIMGKNKKDSLFKNGVWIKEQQGVLTIGTLDTKNKDIMVVPDSLTSKIVEFENDMIEAIYGGGKIAFIPDVVNVGKLLSNIEKQFQTKDLRISFSATKDDIFKGDYNEIYHLVEKFVTSSLSDSDTEEKSPLIYINVSILQNHLCIIYRDSDSISDPSKLNPEIEFIKTDLKGEVSYKKTSGNRCYYDIMIPSRG